MTEKITPERAAVRDLCGVLLIDKPEDFTSFDLCAKLRGMLRTKRIGHAGTLDPMATGLMTVLLGSATRAAELFPDHTKRYTARFLLGTRTDTLDITGTVLEKKPVSVTQQQLEEVLPRFRGTIQQLPPMYSAVHSDGRRLYELAREGKEIERETREVVIHRLELTAFDSQTGTGELDVCCSRGTYIRSLTDDIGNALGCGAVLTSLRRTEALGFGLGQAITLAEAQRLTDEGTIAQRLIPVCDALACYPKCTVTPAQARRYFNGGELDIERIYELKALLPALESPYVRVYGQLAEDGEAVFLGIGRTDREANALRPYKRFV
ncbi:MAG: tRNA pseudouridine(55) synthase TruB [Ruminococcaceae bacterium]|nr:tRNA pseudouridine(55) synthase TruB [Oscillospiraceae bacterium]